MKKFVFSFVLAIMATTFLMAQMPPSNEIWYTSTGGKIVTPNTVDFGEGVTMVSNTYADGKGIIKFNNPVTKIGKKAFNNCRTLASVNLPNTVIHIQNGAFSVCTEMASITIPEGVSIIDDFAFHSCKLEKISLPASIRHIGTPVCANNLKEFEVDADNPIYSSREGILFKGDTLIQYPASKAGESYTISPDIELAKNAFWSSNNLKNITYSEGITSMIFFFFDCRQLISISIPTSLTELKEFSVRSCYSLTSIVVAEGNTKYCSVDGVLFNKEMTSLLLYPCAKNITSYCIPSTVKEIKEYAFTCTKKLESIVLPNGLEKIGRGAFDGSGKLSSITLPCTVKDLGAYLLLVVVICSMKLRF